ncbi:hypothetical protein Patl1_35864 [Pistacia atlantica]|nr:hypothetical protein Patl1_35864 [Pistacia atlantica]
MANNLSSLVNELRERIVASSSTQSNNWNQNDDALESRFRAVLPNLLHAYLVPSPFSNEREVVAVLKLVSHTARNFPGVFYHGKAAAVLPVIGRILPFFAEPAFRRGRRKNESCIEHGVIFETVGPLLSLLRTGARDAYRLLFIDAMLVIEDIVYIASLDADSSSITESTRLTLKCFLESFCGVSSDSISLCDLPASNRPIDGPGIIINLSGKRRWQSFAAWIIKLLSKCLTEGTLYLEGLINLSFVSAACSLLCYGDADLQMACFDFVRIMISVISYDVIPHENLILSISTILSEDKEGLPIFRTLSQGLLFRNVDYDSSIGACLAALHSSCPDVVVKLTATALVTIFPQSMSRTKSQELKVALCSVYTRIAKTCPLHVWRPESLLHTLCSSEPCFPLINCFQVALSVLDSDRVGGRTTTNVSLDLLTSSDNSTENWKVGGKRHICDLYTFKIKRQKVDEEHIVSDDNVTVEHKPTHIFNCDREEEYADYMRVSLFSFVECLDSPSVKPSSLNPDVVLTALSMLCIAFSRYPQIDISLCIFQKMTAWIPWINEQAKQGSLVTLDISIYLEGIHHILLLQSPFFMKTGLFKSKGDGVDLLNVVLKLPWTQPIVVSEPHPPWKTKCSAVRVFSKLGQNLTTEILWSGLNVLPHIFKRLDTDDEKLNHTVGYLLQGFWCSKCDIKTVRNHDLTSKIKNPSDRQSKDIAFSCDLINLLSLYFDLLYDESSEEVQLACVRVIRRILVHGTGDVLLKTRSEWIKCIGFLLLNRKKAIREAFCSQISSFLEDTVLSCLFLDENASSKEHKFLDIIKNALTAADDPQIFETLLESMAEVMMAVDIRSKLFFLSLMLLLEQLDNSHTTVRMNASRLIHKSCYFHVKGGFELLISKAVLVRNELFDYLSVRLASRPKMVREFAEAVFGIETEELLKKMIPVVLPKLVLSQQDNDEAVGILYELAKCLNTDMVPLIVNWLPKVLAYALHQADDQGLPSALEFYRTQTGSDNQEIFAAALPALLDELVCFIDGGDSDEISKRLIRVPQVIKKVAVVLTGSEDLPGFLRNHFVGLLNSIDRKMHHAEDFSLQKQALKRIEMLIKMMGSHLNTYVPKVLVLLLHAIGKESLQCEGLSVLHFFIEQLATVSQSSTKHVISQVFAALIPFLERDKDNPSVLLNQVVKILEELVLKNKAILKQHIHEFPLLPTIPALTEVNRAIQEARGSMTLKDQLRDVVDGLNHENLNVRFRHGCLELSDHFLLRGCAEESRTTVGQRLKLVCVDCLGALGAFDPAKVKGFPCQRFKIECSDDDLIFELIHKHLVRAFRAAPDTIIQDSAALAIQELLKIAGCEASLDENGAASMSQLRKDTESLKRATSCSIFNACRGIVRHDMQAAIYLLPYLVLNAVCHGTEETREGITQEILSVLDAAASENSGAAVHGISGGQSEVCIQAIFTLLDNLGQWVVDVERELTLSQSLRPSTSRPQASKSKDPTPTYLANQDQLLVQCKYVLELLIVIPKVTLAKASFRCQAYERSLMYFESHVRRKSGSFNPAAEKSGIFEDEDVSFLMEVYSCLDESDGLSGLARLRKLLSSQDTLLINKKAGNWAEVLTSCEQALQMDPTSVQRHSDVLNCLLNMCHLQAMVTHVDGLISRIPKYKKTWCMQGVQAAWRLGRWDLMDEYVSGADEEGLLCSSSESNASFDMDVAKILQAMMKKDHFLVAEKIALSKQAVIAPLAAAGMDSYTWAYPFIVKLHLLRELEEFHVLIVNDSFLEKSFHLGDLKFSKVIDNWENRFRFTQPSLWAREPLLAFRRMVFGASGLGAQVGNCWLQYAKVCRLAGHYEIANRAILEAQAAGGPNVHMEKSKLLWRFRRSDGAIDELQKYLLNMPVDVVGSAAISSITRLSLVPSNPLPLLCDTQNLNEKRDVAKTLLLYSRWTHYTGQKQKEDVISLYSRVRELQPTWEKGYFYMAKYCDDVLVDARKLNEYYEGLLEGFARILVCPQQALWIMAAVSKSTVPSRREAAAEIIQAARKGPVKSKDNKYLNRIQYLKKDNAIGNNYAYSTIPYYLPTILGIADEAEILSSLQRPKKIVLLGSDGIERPFLCKPKDDLRKDALIPLTEDCGMVEWVPHTRGLWHILQDIYISCGKFDRQKTNPQIKRIYDQCQGKMPEDEMLKTKILPMFPPVFHKWFLTTFSEPAAWFRARVAYAHTTAVWSMVGHIVGLGDRHGENILFDSTTGDCVHVDFSCLFDKGLQLEKPELVPFRLTQNMIDGLGITGYEGIFLKACEITLQVLRTHRETLMSVLETFIHDPLVEWTKSHKFSGVEVQNPHAQRAISNIQARLQGVAVGVGAAPSLPSGVEGQARRLIAEAVSHRNLGKMYITIYGGCHGFESC